MLGFQARAYAIFRPYRSSIRLYVHMFVCASMYVCIILYLRIVPPARQSVVHITFGTS